MNTGINETLLYETLCEQYQLLESTSSRLELTDLLVKLLKTSPTPVIDLVCYLTTGDLFPPAMGLNLGMQEKMVINALTTILGRSSSEIKDHMNKTGDLGTSVEELKSASKQLAFFSKKLTVQDVYSTFEKIAKESGSGSVDRKGRLLTGLIANANPLEAKYLTRTALGKLRLGIAVMTLVDAIALAFTDQKANRDFVERAYNFDSDIGRIAKIAAEEGLEGIKHVKIQVGYPVRVMSAQRLSSPTEILEKHGKTAVETKYDGERLQIHKDGGKVSIFSRRQEHITHQYPDVVSYIQEGLMAEQAIVEGEVVAYDPDTGEFFPFQILMRRRRKYGIDEAQTEYPVLVFLFDVLLINDESLVDRPFSERRQKLEQIIQPSNNLQLASQKVVSTAEELEAAFHIAIGEGHEGIIAKSLANDAVYQAGGRGWVWIKYKKDYAAELADSVDLVVVGAFWGRGRRQGTYGALLAAAYDTEDDCFKTLCKIGTGFSDDDLVAFRNLLEEFRVSQPPARVSIKKEMEPDVWFEPEVVLEIEGAELTLSPIHTAAWNKIRTDSGLAIRFPRYKTRRIDKAPEQATTVAELIEMYEAQLTKLKK